MAKRELLLTKDAPADSYIYMYFCFRKQKEITLKVLIAVRPWINLIKVAYSRRYLFVAKGPMQSNG